MKGRSIFQYLDYTPPLDSFALLLGFVCLRWSTGDEVDQNIFNTTQMGSEIGVEVSGWCEVVYVESVTDYVHVPTSKY